MTYQISFLKHRAQYLQEQLGDKFKEISQNDDFINCEITVDNSKDILDLFHAGVRSGVNDMLDK